MSDTTIIAKEARLTGKITGGGDVEIHGHLDGDIDVDGEVTVESNGTASSSITARRIIVRGAVKGDLIASERVELGDSARVVGDLRAPRIAIAVSALVRGHVATNGGDARPARGANGAARHAAPKPEAEPVRARAAAPEREPRTERNDHRPVPTARGSAPQARRPPPPAVVPVLKKGAKAVHKRR